MIVMKFLLFRNIQKRKYKCYSNDIIMHSMGSGKMSPVPKSPSQEKDNIPEEPQSSFKDAGDQTYVNAAMIGN